MSVEIIFSNEKNRGLDPETVLLIKTSHLNNRRVLVSRSCLSLNIFPWENNKHTHTTQISIQYIHTIHTSTCVKGVC